MNDLDHARQLQSMAAKDLKALMAMTDPDQFDNEIFGFHAQQAVEKSLKAWISALGGTYDVKHDLRLPLISLRKLGCDVAPFEDMLSLNAYAVRLRYEPLDAADYPLDRSMTITKVQSLYDHVQQVIALAESKRQ